MKNLNLTLRNKNNEILCIFGKKDIIKILLPVNSIFELTEGYQGKVTHHYYNDEKSEFVTHIEICHPEVLNFNFDYFKEQLLQNDWVIIHQNSKLIFHDKFE